MTAALMQYFEPNFLDEALVVLDRFGPRAKVLAGGTRVVPSLREDSGDVIALVNLKRIASLGSISISDGRVRIGALVSAAELAQSPPVATALPLLAAAAASMGSRQIRRLATIGGNICSGDPASDLTVALLASDASCVLATSGHGERRLPLRDVLVPGGTICVPHELLTAVDVPVAQARTSYQKMTTRRSFEMALVAVAVAIDSDQGRRGATRIALAGAAPMCVRAPHAEQVASGSSPDGDGRDWAARVGAAAAAHDASPESDERANVDYRRHLVAVLTARALVAALAGQH